MKIFLEIVGVILLAVVIGSVSSIMGLELYHQYKTVEYLKARTSPVVTNMQVTGMIEIDGSLWIRVFGNKHRNCGAPLTVYGDYGPNAEYRFTEILFLDDKTEDGVFKKPDDNKTDNKDDVIDFGWWSLKPNPIPDPFSLYSIHSCNGNLVTTFIGRFDPKDFIKELNNDN